MEVYIDLVLKPFGKSSQKSSATGKMYSILHDVSIQLRRSVLKNMQYGRLYLGYGLVQAVGYLLICDGP